MGRTSGTIQSLDPTTAKELETWSMETPISDLWMSPDGKTVIGATDRGLLTPAKNFVENDLPLHGLSYLPGGKLLAVGCIDGRIYLCDTQAWEFVDQFACVSEKRLLDSFVDRGKRGMILTRNLALMPDGKTLLSGGADGFVKRWDISEPGLSAVLAPKIKEAWWVTFSPDGRTLIAGGEYATIRLWDARTREQRTLLGGHSSVVMAGTLSRDGNLLATADFAGKIQLWNMTDRENQRPTHKPLAGHKGPVRVLALSPDGATLASGGDDGTVRLWDTATGKQRLLLTKESKRIHGLVFHPTGKVLASGGAAMRVDFWDPATGERLHTFDEITAVRCLAYAPDGGTLAIGLEKDGKNGMVRLLQGDNFEELATLSAHGGT